MEQEVRYYLQTLEQIEQSLNKLTSTLNTQEIATSHPIEDAQVTTVNDNIQSVLAQIEQEPLKWIQSFIL